MKSNFISGFLNGLSGLEIGGGSGPCDYELDVINVNHPECSVWDAEQLKYSPVVRKVDIVADATEIPVPDTSYDFVFSSHVLEHLPNPIKAIKEQYRISKKYVCMVVPQRDAVDGHREITTLEETIDRYNNNNTVTNLLGHLSVWNWSDMWKIIQWGNENNLWKFKLRGVLNPDDARKDGWIIVLEVIK
jgi:ubiquinone/menaquinone biosynthesis C-methylase UbiE